MTRTTSPTPTRPVPDPRPGHHGGAPRVAVVVKGYPRLSETFIAQEILALQRRGLDQLIVSLRRPTDPAIHDLHRAITAPVLYLPEYLYEAPERVEAGRDWARTRPGYAAAYAAFRRDLRRDPTTNRWRRFGQACVLARELPPDIDWLHSHYLHTPASVTRYAAMIRGLGWSFSAHAKDIWTTDDWDLQDKLGDAAWGVTCTSVNLRHLQGLAVAAGAPAERVALVYHGLDLTRFPDPPTRPPRDGRDPEEPIRLLTVGRAVEKKGFDDLLRALAALPADLHWRLTHIGGGGLTGQLQTLAEDLGLADRVTWRGAQAHGAVLEAYAAADLFVLAAKIAADGDRDGLPNVLMEAQVLGLPVVASDVSAIGELVIPGETGVLVPPEAPAPLARAMAELIVDPTRRAALGAAGRRRVRTGFGMDAGIEALAARFGLPTDPPAPAAVTDTATPAAVPPPLAGERPA